MKKYDQKFLLNSAEVFFQIIEYPWVEIPYDNEVKQYIKIEFGQRIGVSEPDGTYKQRGFVEPTKYSAKYCKFDDPGIKLANPEFYICPDFEGDEVYLQNRESTSYFFGVPYSSV